MKNGNWQIIFEDYYFDLIGHLYTKDWEFDYTVRTG